MDFKLSSERAGDRNTDRKTICLQGGGISFKLFRAIKAVPTQKKLAKSSDLSGNAFSIRLPHKEFP
jgi:hypothetical protein